MQTSGSIRLTLLLLSTLALSSCASGSAVSVTFTTLCPPLREYTPAQQAEVAKEVRKLGPGSQTGGFIQDYGTLRAQVRSCQAIGK